jgi:peptide chain release factor 2
MDEKENVIKNINKITDYSTPNNYIDLQRKLIAIENKYSWINEIEQRLIELCDDYEIAVLLDDTKLINLCHDELLVVENRLISCQKLQLFNEKYDISNCFIQIISGAGGLDSSNWAFRLSKMYINWSQYKNMQLSIVEENFADGTQHGYRNATFHLKGEYAYGLMKVEAGVHRMVRNSPFDANHRRHTSFAKVLVYPEIEDELSNSNSIEVKSGDLKIDTFKAGGPGGQHVNKTDSAIRITHLPTGIIVSCQSDRSQHRNKATALSMLKSKLWKYHHQSQQELKKNTTVGDVENTFGSQIKSIVFSPYQLVKDHRTGWETKDVESYLAGGKVLDEAILHSLENLSLLSTNQ